MGAAPCYLTDSTPIEAVNIEKQKAGPEPGFVFGITGERLGCRKLSGQVCGHFTLCNVPQAGNGLDDTVAGELVGMRRRVGFNLRQVGQDYGADDFRRYLTYAYDFG